MTFKVAFSFQVFAMQALPQHFESEWLKWLEPLDKGRLSEPILCFCPCFTPYVSNRIEDLIGSKTGGARCLFFLHFESVGTTKACSEV